jgi:hypothetical protein
MALSELRQQRRASLSPKLPGQGKRRPGAVMPLRGRIASTSISFAGVLMLVSNFLENQYFALWFCVLSELLAVFWAYCQSKTGTWVIAGIVMIVISTDAYIYLHRVVYIMIY